MASPSPALYKIYATLSAQIAVRIGNAIVDEEFEPGQKLREVDLAAAFGVSRASVREALRMVEREGLITVLPQRGAQVTSLTAQEVQDVLRDSRQPYRARPPSAGRRGVGRGAQAPVGTAQGPAIGTRRRRSLRPCQLGDQLVLCTQRR